LSEIQVKETHRAGRIERRADQVLAAIWIVVGIVVLVQAQSLPYMSRFGPGSGFLIVWLGIGFIAFGLLLLAQVTLRAPRKRAFTLPDAESAWRMILIMAGFFVFVYFADRLGFLFCIGLLSFFLLLVVERKGPIPSLVMAVLITAGFWAVFELGLQMRLPLGILDFS
jgi:hypothetical protein